MKFRKTNERGFASEFYDTKQRMNDNFTKHFPWCFSVYYIHTETCIIPFHSSEKSSFAVCTWTIYFSHMKSAVRGNSFAYDILRYGFFMSMSQYETLFPFRFFFFYKPPSILVPVFLGGGAISRRDLASRRVVTLRSEHLPCGFLIILFLQFYASLFVADINRTWRTSYFGWISTVSSHKLKKAEVCNSRTTIWTIQQSYHGKYCPAVLMLGPLYMRALDLGRGQLDPKVEGLGLGIGERVRNLSPFMTVCGVRV